MKVLGIDYGEKRVGLAVSDETQTLARELDIVALKDFFGQIEGILEANEVSIIVVGWPLNLSGQETKKTQEVRSFIEKLKTQTGMEIKTIDERFTSVMAEGLPGGKQNTDSLAAQILLQNYLDKNKKT